MTCGQGADGFKIDGAVSLHVGTEIMEHISVSTGLKGGDGLQLR